jgi:hypothetical protein
LIFAIFWHFVLEKYWWASLGAALSSTFITFIFALGAHYNFYGENVLVDVAKVFVLSFLFSMLIGAVFTNFRKKNVHQKS